MSFPARSDFSRFREWRAVLTRMRWAYPRWIERAMKARPSWCLFYRT